MEHKAFHSEQSTIPYRRIGAGFCGSVWSQPDHDKIDSASTAIKREDGGPGRSLHNDFTMHKIILQAYEECPDQIRDCFLIPKCYDFIPATYSGWDATNVIKRFPENYLPCNTLITQRIPPIPKNGRDVLINKYCSPPLADNISADVKNSDCLVRPYLGRRKFGQRESKVHFFSLRNYPLHIDQMSDLDLDPPQYATGMAKALAFMHWSAGVDANDVEFVLAPAPRPATPRFHSQQLGSHNLWILDFDCCRRMRMDQDGVMQAAQAFLRNDPFYPRPGRENTEDKELWNHFRNTFLEVSSFILQTGNKPYEELPLLLMDTIESLVQKRTDNP
ncbi:hypothetical protein JX265_001788 [Neoarthrinium moseri]|uniref:DUF3669 domain-containing protein n=1 Tax=Neoarthrinium moseri TaxID=1658444 RepID=A0A9P9WVT2_9PEZI|nr:hypothetical protein JX265_001788 [Neoarthrinium moseri]